MSYGTAKLKKPGDVHARTWLIFADLVTFIIRRLYNIDHQNGSNDTDTSDKFFARKEVYCGENFHLWFVENHMAKFSLCLWYSKSSKKSRTYLGGSKSILVPPIVHAH